MRFGHRMGYDESRRTTDRERVRTQASYMHFKNRLLGISANLSRDTGPHTGETLSRQLLCSSSDTFNLTQSLSPSEELSGLRKSASPEGPQDHFRGVPSWVLQTLSQPSCIRPQETSRHREGWTAVSQKTKDRLPEECAGLAPQPCSPHSETKQSSSCTQLRQEQGDPVPQPDSLWLCKEL